jgi:predicted RNase H-like HicB family nuclease
MKTKWWILSLAFLFLLGCYSNKNKTEEQARERIKQFMFLMATDQVEEAEKLLSSTLFDSDKKEFFLSNFDNRELKDTTDIVINIEKIYIPENDPKNRAMVSMTISSQKSGFTKIVSMPLTYEKGNWYIGS